MKSFAFVTLMRSFFDHLKMTASKVDAKKKEDELERQLKQEELDGYDKAINEEWQKLQHAKREIVWEA
jgi:hypothetical protein